MRTSREIDILFFFLTFYSKTDRLHRQVGCCSCPSLTGVNLRRIFGHEEKALPQIIAVRIFAISGGIAAKTSIFFKGTVTLSAHISKRQMSSRFTVPPPSKKDSLFLDFL
ncbi:hypothetical protein [Nitrososphaera sp.]|uniref:hypothetical protein n=1 Tax=Nitrososphaera sp. TaxID=1971748 RepID=UPI00307CF2DF